MAQFADLLIVNAAELLTLKNPNKRPKIKDGMNDLGIIKNGALAIRGEEIAGVGTTEEILDLWKTSDERFILDVSGRVVMAGFVDCHTHLVFGGSREEEFALKIRGAGYLEILEKGGGILKTVKDTGDLFRLDLLKSSLQKLDVFLKNGTTTLEIKSGYGLSWGKERNILCVINKLTMHNMHNVVPTFLGAHAFPLGVDHRRYLDQILFMVEFFALTKLAEYCDVFCETGAFSIEETEEIFKKAKGCGMKLKIHAGEFNDIGGAELGVKYGVTSIDHLDYVSDNAIALMADSKTVGVLLPAVPFHLMINHYAPARKMIEAGVPVALATDFNPGSAPVLSMQMVIALACRQMKMTPAEAITASTINAAYAIDMADKVGSLEIGKQADIIVLDIPNHLQLPYWLGINMINSVIKKGRKLSH